MNSGATVDRGMSVTRVSSGGGAADSTLEGGGSMHFSSVGGDGGDCDVPPHSSQQTQSHTDARPQHHPPPQHHPVPSQQAYPNELPLGLNTSTSGMDDVDKLLQVRLTSAPVVPSGVGTATRIQLCHMRSEAQS